MARRPKRRWKGRRRRWRWRLAGRGSGEKRAGYGLLSRRRGRAHPRGGALFIFGARRRRRWRRVARPRKQRRWWNPPAEAKISPPTGPPHPPPARVGGPGLRSRRPAGAPGPNGWPLVRLVLRERGGGRWGGGARAARGRGACNATWSQPATDGGTWRRRARWNARG